MTHTPKAPPKISLSTGLTRAGIKSKLQRFLFKTPSTIKFTQIKALLAQTLDSNLAFRRYCQKVRDSMRVENQRSALDQSAFKDHYLEALVSEINLSLLLSQVSQAVRRILDKLNLDFFALVINPESFFGKERGSTDDPRTLEALDRLQKVIEHSRLVLENYEIFGSRPTAQIEGRHCALYQSRRIRLAQILQPKAAEFVDLFNDVQASLAGRSSQESHQKQSLASKLFAVAVPPETRSTSSLNGSPECHEPRRLFRGSLDGGRSQETEHVVRMSTVFPVFAR